MDCLEGMKLIPDKSVDLILCDLPYGTTACKWDTIIPFEPMWKEYERIIKDNGAIVLTASQPFTSSLVMSNPKLFRYSWVWDKTRGNNFQLAKKQPMKSHEDILVFYKKQPTYSPQYWYSTPYKNKAGRSEFRKNTVELLEQESSAALYRPDTVSEDGRRYPLSILTFKHDLDRFHPTQKPVPLFEYLIQTYTNENEIVLDNCIGSGTTALACVNTNRKFIGFETEPKYIEIANKRLDGIYNADDDEKLIQ
jgi:site-specific DNA-methyltransferase (adenine-specific)